VGEEAALVEAPEEGSAEEAMTFLPDDRWTLAGPIGRRVAKWWEGRHYDPAVTDCEFGAERIERTMTPPWKLQKPELAVELGRKSLPWLSA
jgi:hypothetical protein